MSTPTSTPMSTGTISASSSASTPVSTSSVDNILFATYVLVSLASVTGAFCIYRLISSAVCYIRRLTCLNNDTQMYFRMPHVWFGRVKKHLLYAPLFRSRHMQELQLLGRWGIGVLPTRFQTIFLSLVIGMNIALCATGIEWSQAGTPNMLDHLRNRAGTLAVVNLIPLVIMGGRNNPLIQGLKISFDTFNLVHRWFGRIIVIEAVVHTISFTVKAVKLAGWKGIQEELRTSKLIISGFIGTVGFIFIILHSSAILRHAFYETFLHMHILVVILVFGALYIHLEGLQQLIYVQIAIAAWATERGVRLALMIYRNAGRGGTVAIIEPLAGDAIRVTIKMARPWNYQPGQYMFLTLPSIGLWTSHPFSAAWSDTEERLDSEKGLAMNRQDVLALQHTTISAVIRRRDGFTNALYKRAEKAQGRLTMTALVEGPYGGLHSLRSYGSVLIFAGGVGITHQVGYIRDLVAGFANGTVAARRVTLVWIIQSPEHLEWIRPWMTAILALDKRRDVLRIQLFVTRPRATKEIHSPSATVQMFPGRPNVDTLVGLECEAQVGAMGVSVCGTGALADDVRAAVRRRQGLANVDFVEESYSW
ncbi:hypothetical protein MMC34_000780 [Xylographa carneopallida]|nr:hypothetical protein [Xylographa carneopallida]